MKAEQFEKIEILKKSNLIDASFFNDITMDNSLEEMNNFAKSIGLSEK